MRNHAKKIACKNRTDKRLVPREVERGCFRCEEDELNEGSDRKYDKGTTDGAFLLVTPPYTRVMHAV